MLTDNQLLLIQQAGLDFNPLDQASFLVLSQNPQDLTACSDQALIAFLQLVNALYRGGEPIISDADYDHVFV